jgi:hypothetical protein
LFWRRERGKDNGAPIVFRTVDRRVAFRVRPRPGEPVHVVVGSDRIAVEDISARGLSMGNRGFRPGDRFPVTIELPGSRRPLAAVLEILKVRADDVCHCRFSAISEEDAEAIHLYILRVQREELRAG